MMYLVINLVPLVLVSRKIGIINPIGLAVIYIYGCMVSFVLIKELGLSKDQLFFTAMPIPSFDMVYDKSLTIYTLIVVLLYSSSWGLCKNNSKPFMNTLVIKKRELGGSSNFFIITIVIFTAANIVNVVHFLSLDQSLIYENSSYLTIKNPSEIGISNPLMRIYHFLFRFAGMLSLIAFFYFIRINFYYQALLALSFSLYCMLILIAGASRWVAVYFAVLTCYFFISDVRYRGVGVITSLFLMFLSFLLALLGRSSGAYGIAHISSYFSLINMESVLSYFSGFLVNIFEGVFNLANSLQLSPDFNSWYKVHSFLPLFSFVDDFHKYIGVYAAKFAPHVPMSAISEALMFGAPYFVLFIFIYIALARISTKFILSYENKIVALALCSPVLYVLIASHTYSVRTVMKPALFFILVFWCLNRWDRKKRRTMHQYDEV